MDRGLEKVIEAARRKEMSPEEKEEQRINFAYGNAPDGDKGTHETVKAASTIMRETSANS
jgi:hypothetical protein